MFLDEKLTELAAIISITVLFSGGIIFVLNIQKELNLVPVSINAKSSFLNISMCFKLRIKYTTDKNTDK